ncbi:enoyl-CoA hydratase [Sphingomonas panacis]|uniref:Enoyl-CoA hydratase n=1 Tax=Sphingomonas panacis TaxID=1560345 RepID=A0A1B3Z796_9SPHN|nr:enoyl-CoA hydratase/isomerase family protein [Sphingomonas panacis]AOH83301.1 enoyl-CoA hydratase [Sphingomonas panacis]
MTITVIRHGAVAIVAFDRPAMKNAFTIAMRAEFCAAFAALEEDRAVRAVILTGTAGNFCSGADIREMGETPPGEFLGRMRTLHAMARAIASFRAPVIAAVDGVCIGAAWGFAMASDLVLASEAVRFAATFRRIGYAPDAGLAWHFLRTINPMRAREIIYSGREVHAEEALRLGLALEILPAADLLDRALTMAREIAEGPATALHLAKRQFAAGSAMSLDSFLDYEATMQPLLGQTEDHREAVAAFREKRTPTFKDL